MVREASGDPERPRGWLGGGQAPARCWLIDSPTITHREREVQLTAVKAWGVETVAAFLHGRPGDPVRTATPA
jgi:hypothetical protein